ncbi:MAG TPA: nuclear transport factor 2 family protein [Mucilaginibacter sp.]|nr:nuclear transport factor 2 family protein [Mucilaginibacter sp.]
MKRLLLLSMTISLTSALLAQQASTAAIKKTINNMMDAMLKGDSTLLRSVLAKDMQVQSVEDDKSRKVQISTTSAGELITAIGTPHTDAYDEHIVFDDIKIDGPLASVRTSYTFFLGTTFSHCGVNFFQLIQTEDGWKTIYIAYTVRKDNCTP